MTLRLVLRLLQRAPHGMREVPVMAVVVALLVMGGAPREHSLKRRSDSK